MTTMIETRLPEALQGLIDARLDTIDRMLLGRLPRSERLAIVGQVEDQLHEMLGEHQSDDWSREDVLNVLARLDPPEAYLPDPDEPGATATAIPSARPAPPRRSATAPPSRLGGVLGIISLVIAVFGLPVNYVFAELIGGLTSFLFGCGFVIVAVLILAIVGLVQSVLHRDAGGWRLAGLVLNIVALVVGLAQGVGSLLLVL